jgi:RNA polymerase sigma-70 factor (ECF subfamily)
MPNRLSEEGRPKLEPVAQVFFALRRQEAPYTGEVASTWLGSLPGGEPFAGERTTNQKMRELRLVHRHGSEGADSAPPQTGLVGDDYALVAGIRRGDPAAASALYDQYRALVERTLVRILGFDSELPDTLQETFIRALGSTHLLREPKALPAWMIRIAVCTASDLIRRRRRGRLLHLFSEPSDVLEASTATVFEAESDLEARRALVAAQSLLNGLPLRERTAFSLRRLEGMELKDVAHACGCSLATIKRRLARAEERFLARAQKQPALKNWLAEKMGEQP